MYARSRSASNVGLGAGEGALGRGEGALERGVGGERRPDAIAVAIDYSLQLSSSLVRCSSDVLPVEVKVLEREKEEREDKRDERQR